MGNSRSANFSETADDHKGIQILRYKIFNENEQTEIDKQSKRHGKKAKSKENNATIIKLKDEPEKDITDTSLEVKKVLEVIENNENHLPEEEKSTTGRVEVEGEVKEIAEAEQLPKGRNGEDLLESKESTKDGDTKTEEFPTDGLPGSTAEVLEPTQGTLDEAPEEKNDTTKEEDAKSQAKNHQGDMELLQLEHHFNSNPIDLTAEASEVLKEIRKKADTFEPGVSNYRGSDYSLEYYVLDENLTRLLELLDKIKCHENKELLEEKISTIDFIKSLHERLDNNVTQDS